MISNMSHNPDTSHMIKSKVYNINLIQRFYDNTRIRHMIGDYIFSRYLHQNT